MSHNGDIIYKLSKQLSVTSPTDMLLSDPPGSASESQAETAGGSHAKKTDEFPHKVKVSMAQSSGDL
jgi:hypothetical protein